MSKNDAEESNQSTWVSKRRNYEEEKKSLALPTKLVSNEEHPLKPVLETSKSQQKLSKVSSKPIFDPLSEGSSIDPLSKMVADVSLKEKKEIIKMKEAKSNFEPWSFKKI